MYDKCGLQNWKMPNYICTKIYHSLLINAHSTTLSLDNISIAALNKTSKSSLKTVQKKTAPHCLIECI